MSDFDYSNYTLDELYDVEWNIDALSYPDKYKEILSQIKKKQEQGSNLEEQSPTSQKFESQHDDPIAKKTDGFPLVKGGSNFKTHTLKKVSRSKLIFTPSIGLILFTLLFLGFCLFFIGQFDNTLLKDGVFPSTWDETKSTFIPIIFLIISLYMLVKLSEEIVFDKRRGLYYKGFKQLPRRIDNSKRKKNFARFSDIHAVQLLCELCDGSDDSQDFYSFELNLILNSGRRLGVIDHGNYLVIKNDAQMISNFLDIPLWEQKEEKKRNFFGKILGLKF